MSKIILKDVRLSFPSLFHKAVFDGKETKFEATFLIDKAKNAAKIKEIKAAIEGMIKDDLKGSKLPPDKICMKDGDSIEYAGYAGTMSLKASSTKRPIIIDRDKSPLTEDDNKFYAGCYVNASLELWAQNNQFGKRINCNLLGVQFFKDGEPFADGVKGSIDDFEAFTDEDVDFI
jgi:hypothetical protein